jgi:hypothetical protein
MAETPAPKDFDEEFDEAVEKWREQHHLTEDDAVVLLVELFRLHQAHWDELRRKEMPSFEHFRQDIQTLSQASKTFVQQSAALSELLANLPVDPVKPAKILLSTAFYAAMAALLAGYLLGRI